MHMQQNEAETQQNQSSVVQTKQQTKGSFQFKKNSGYKTKEAAKPLIQARQRPIQRHEGYQPHAAKQQPIQRKTTQKSEKIAQTMGQQYGVDTSSLQFNHNSSFPGKLGAEATIQGNKIDFAPGKDSEANIKHEVGHAIDNAKNGTPKGDKVVNGQMVDTTREAAADKMMNAPLQLQKAEMFPNFSATTHSNTPVQRKVFVDDSEVKEHKKKAIFDALERSSSVFTFANDEELDNVIDILEENPSLIRIATGQTFRRLLKTSKNFLSNLRNTLIEEWNEITSMLAPEEVLQARVAFGRAAQGGVAAETLVRMQQVVEDFTQDAFKITERYNEPTYSSKKGLSVTKRNYGYHLTAIKNLSGIAATGLSPSEGGKDRGSCSMCTEDQKKGSEQTSTGVIAFGIEPSVFRTYINQYEDNRQLNQEQHKALKPVMLRFHMDKNMRKDAKESEDGNRIDYMDSRARNTTMRIAPPLIDVLTNEGWIPLLDYQYDEQQILELREVDNDPKRDNKNWDNTGAYSADEARGIMPALTKVNVKDPRTDLAKLRDKSFAHSAGTFTFRGATMQDSGNLNTWEYVFSLKPKSKKIDKWINEAIGKYVKNYSGKNERHLKEFEQSSMFTSSSSKSSKSQKNKSSSKKSSKGSNSQRSGTYTGNFNEIETSGEGLNCLLWSVTQGAPHIDPQEEYIKALRAQLERENYVQPNDMIDIYGGAGAVLASTLGIRIQVIELTGGGEVQHPELGTGGPLVTILHDVNHFSTLQPRN